MGRGTTMDDLRPLSAAEKRRATEIAAADRRVGALAGARNAPVLARPLTSDRRAPAGRHALLGFYDYDHNRSVVAVVDLDAGTVVTVEDAAAVFQLSAEEIRDAEKLAGRDATIRAFLAGRKLNALTRLYFPPWAGRDDPPHRYAIVFARPSNSERRYGIVDLSALRLVEVLSPDRLTGQ